MLKAIQECIKKTMTVSDAFKALDSGVGFITLQDFAAGLGHHFDLTLKQNELRALFLEVDSDGNGIVKYGEFDAFYRMNYDERVKELETEREQMVT
jgi:Ca2+-binding EF-hand superfamily protein